MTNIKELFFDLKWLLLGILLCGFIGTIIAGSQVLLLEQTPSGRYAAHQECVLWDEVCAKDCIEVAQENQRGASCDSCCLKHAGVVDPLGKRIYDLALRYGLIGSGIGVTIGLVIAEEKKKKI